MKQGHHDLQAQVSKSLVPTLTLTVPVIKLGWKVEDDGMFWMKLPDFLLNFSNLYIVRNFNTSWKALALA